MHLKSSIFALLSLAALPILNSCGGSDGESDLTLEERDTLTAESLEPTDISAGDIITFTPGDNYTSIAGSFPLGPSGSTVVGTAAYEYKKIGDYIFSLNQTNSVAPQEALSRALVVTLSGQAGSDAALDSRLRVLLHRSSPDFSDSELSELTSILNPSGANLAVVNDELAVLTSSLYVLEVTSNRGDQRRGTMGGVYYRESDSIVIGFKPPTDTEKAALRFVDDDFLIPFVTTSFRSSELTEEGVWSLRLINSVD